MVPAHLVPVHLHARASGCFHIRPVRFWLPLRGVFWRTRRAPQHLREQGEGLSEEQARDVLAMLASRRLVRRGETVSRAASASAV
jgi:hypothetical protein